MVEARLTTSAKAPATVSIGLPVYNGARYVARALESLLAQDWPAIDILVSDNASTDDSAAIAEAYGARDARVRVVRSSVNVGFEGNFARVLQAATGEYFMWAACDDSWHPQFVSRLVAALEHTPGAVVAMSAVERVDESGEAIDVVRFEGSADPSAMSPWRLTMKLAGGRPYHLFIYGLYRTSFIKRAFTGFAAVIASDRLLVCRIAMAARFAYVNDVLHRRLVRSTPIADRYADEPLGRLWHDSRARWRLAFAAGPYLWRSPVLPAARRWWVAPVALRFMKASLGHTLIRAIRRANFANIATSTRDAGTQSLHRK
jgi:glycosyltransferase involved in cell wall biosynthesis